jgi:MFS family permease
MALLGLTAGGATVLFGTVWAELYGPAHLGAIRALAVSLMVVATALAPALLGALIDLGVSLDAQFLALAVYVLACIVVLLRVRAQLTSRPPAHPS